MTISIRGVTHYSNGELDYQVRGLWPMGSLPRVDLADWQRDQDMYRTLPRRSPQAQGFIHA